jgi:hypothetical protein
MAAKSLVSAFSPLIVRKSISRLTCPAERHHSRYIDGLAARADEAPARFQERRNEIEAALLEIKGLLPTIRLGEER